MNGQKKILVVGNTRHDGINRYFESVLTKAGYAVETAYDLEGAVRAECDGVLLTTSLVSSKTGLTLGLAIEELRERGLPVLLVTSLPEAAEEAKRHGAIIEEKAPGKDYGAVLKGVFR